MVLPFASLGDGAHQHSVGRGGVLGVGRPRREHVAGAPRKHPGAHDGSRRQRKRPRRRRRCVQVLADHVHERVKPRLGRGHRIPHQRRRLRRDGDLQPIEEPPHQWLGHV